MIHPDATYLRTTLYRITDGGASRRSSGIAKRLHAVAREIVERYPDDSVARSLAVQIETEIENIQGLCIDTPRRPAELPAQDLEWQL